MDGLVLIDSTKNKTRQGFCMDTDQAYATMEEANQIIEDFPVSKYAIYTILFLLEIALCFAVLYAI
jgi:hypothetical protein